MFYGSILGPGFAFVFGSRLIGFLVTCGILTPSFIKLSGKAYYEENFYKKLRDSKEIKEEREIYIEAMTKIDSHFMKYIKPYEEENKKNIVDILYSILSIYYQLESVWINTRVEEYRKKKFKYL